MHDCASILDGIAKWFLRFFMVHPYFHIHSIDFCTCIHVYTYVQHVHVHVYILYV